MDLFYTIAAAIVAYFVAFYAIARTYSSGFSGSKRNCCALVERYLSR